jgi:hypothetical protein
MTDICAAKIVVERPAVENPGFNENETQRRYAPFIDMYASLMKGKSYLRIFGAHDNFKFSIANIVHILLIFNKELNFETKLNNVLFLPY